mmetsp:Transcript_10090/g.40916  ORF Transcript_10090/g.40916 Transcript_10090/m.40916 type:complete len:257 (-) Transcript_10090:494-1264(-)
MRRRALRPADRGRRQRRDRVGPSPQLGERVVVEGDVRRPPSVRGGVADGVVQEPGEHPAVPVEDQRRRGGVARHARDRPRLNSPARGERVQTVPRRFAELLVTLRRDAEGHRDRVDQEAEMLDLLRRADSRLWVVDDDPEPLEEADGAIDARPVGLALGREEVVEVREDPIPESAQRAYGNPHDLGEDVARVGEPEREHREAEADDAPPAPVAAAITTPEDGREVVGGRELEDEELPVVGVHLDVVVPERLVHATK